MRVDDDDYYGDEDMVTLMMSLGFLYPRRRGTRVGKGAPPVEQLGTAEPGHTHTKSSPYGMSKKLKVILSRPASKI